MSHASRNVEIYYRFACKACRFVRQSREKERTQLDYCPGCGYPKDAAGHVYREGPRPGEDFDA